MFLLAIFQVVYWLSMKLQASGVAGMKRPADQDNNNLRVVAKKQKGVRK
jgi:hypothetical protein